MRKITLVILTIVTMFMISSLVFANPNLAKLDALADKKRLIIINNPLKYANRHSKKIQKILR